MCIYKLTNTVNGKIYIGYTTDTHLGRFNQHISKSHSADTYIARAMRKYGVENFTTEVIDTADTVEELLELEVYYIAKYDSTNQDIGYNMHRGGSENPMLSPVVKAKHAESMRKPETRKNISKGMKAYRAEHPFTEEHRHRLSESMKGNHNFGTGDTRSIPCYCIDENGVRHDFHSYKEGGIWWFENYKPFGDRCIHCTLLRKIKASIEGKKEFSVKWFNKD